MTVASGFRRGPAAAIIAGVLIALCLTLAAWQVRRGAEQRALGERLAAAGSLPILEHAPEAASWDDHLFRRLSLAGRYVPATQFLLDGMTHDGAAGYHVLTPFRPQNSERWVLVNRGWVEADPDRSVLPDIEVADDPRTVAGRIARLPRPGLRLGESPAPSAAPAPAVVTLLYPTLDELSAHLAHPLYDYQLLLDAEAPNGFTREWQAPAGEPWRHWGYALQWLAFALVLAVLSYRVWRGSFKER